MQLAADIQKQLSEYVVNPQVTVIVAEFKSKKVYVQGEVNRPGEVVIKGKITVLEAVTASGSPTRYANLKKVQVIRGEAKHPMIIPVDLYSVMFKGNAKQNILLQNQDILFVPPKGLIKVGYACDIILFPFTSILRLAGLGTIIR
jgi:polysaccharide export outer membrane protein